MGFLYVFFFFFKQKTAYEIKECDWSSDVCSSDLSLPKVKAQVTRPTLVTVEAQDLTGQVVTHSGDGLFARCMQHEIDHLDGILFIDKISQAARLNLREEIEQLEEAFALKSR